VRLHERSRHLSIALQCLAQTLCSVSLLPVDLFRQQIENQLMQIVITEPPAPLVRYDAIFLKQSHSALGYMVADVARRCCDFSSGGQQPTAR